MKNEKTVYQPPEFTVIAMNARDALTTSGGSDAFDNRSDDVFGN